MHLPIPFFSLLLLIHVAVFAQAQSPAALINDFQQARRDGLSSYLVDIDNDSLLFNGDDRFYTSGLRMSGQYAMSASTSTTIFGWRVGQEIYTPSDIKLSPSNIPESDRPYAAWLYAGVFKETHFADGSYRRFGIDVGCLGPCAGGEAAQKGLHRLIDDPLPRGWRTQLGNEWGAVLYADVAPVRWRLNGTFDLTPSWGGRFGNIHADVNAGLTLRAGQLNQLPGQPTLHGFVRLNGRAVAYDATLQGGYFRNDSVRTVDSKRWVGEAEAGFVWRRRQYGLHASVVRRRNEIRDLSDSTGAQNFVRLQFLYTP